jgi:hypothetical protein
MNPADHNPRPLPRYGNNDDAKTRPCVILFDWNGDEEATVRVSSPERAMPVAPSPRGTDRYDLDEIDDDMFRPRWHGIGRQPGKMALAVVLGISFTIGVIAMLGAAEAQAEAADTASLR